MVVLIPGYALLNITRLLDWMTKRWKVGRWHRKSNLSLPKNQYQWKVTKLATWIMTFIYSNVSLPTINIANIYQTNYQTFFHAKIPFWTVCNKQTYSLFTQNHKKETAFVIL